MNTSHLFTYLLTVTVLMLTPGPDTLHPKLDQRSDLEHPRTPQDKERLARSFS
jgi:hypothetical protein